MFPKLQVPNNMHPLLHRCVNSFVYTPSIVLNLTTIELAYLLKREERLKESLFNRR